MINSFSEFVEHGNIACMAKDKKSYYILIVTARHSSGEESKTTTGNRPDP